MPATKHGLPATNTNLCEQGSILPSYKHSRQPRTPPMTPTPPAAAGRDSDVGTRATGTAVTGGSGRRSQVTGAPPSRPRTLRGRLNTAATQPIVICTDSQAARNERADALAAEAAALSQEKVPADARTLVGAARRAAARQCRASWPAGFFRNIMGDRSPMPVPGDDRDAAVNVHQLRAGHWGRAESYLHRIGRRPTTTCAGCNGRDRPASRCIVCRE